MSGKKKWEDFEVRLKHKDIILLSKCKIPDAAKTLYLVMLAYRNIHSKKCQISKAKFAEDIDKTEKQVWNLMKNLIDCKLIEVEFSNGRSPNIYTIRTPTEAISKAATM